MVKTKKDSVHVFTELIITLRAEIPWKIEIKHDFGIQILDLDIVYTGMFYL